MVHNLFILDWDDTIFPTSHRTRGEFRHFTEKDLSDNKDLIFSTIDVMACTMVSGMLEMGGVSIVTNAGESWFKKSLRYMPLLLGEIENRQLLVLTADSAKKDTVKKQSTLQRAKKINFETALKQFYSDRNISEKSRVNLISIGDQDTESEAAFLMSTKHSSLRSKCLKLRPFPVVDIIECQLMWISDRLKSISKLDKKFEIIEVFVDNVQNLKLPDKMNKF